MAGIDAAEPFVDIARMRTPDGDFRVGDMFDLPWADDAFDLVSSFNGIFGGCERAVVEIARVLRTGGHVAITFWNLDGNDDMLSTFAVALGELAPPAEHDAGAKLIEIGVPGVAEAMVEHAGLVPLERGVSTNAQDFADIDAVVRAFSATGPARAAIEHVGEERWHTTLRQLYEPYVTDSGLVRIVNTIGWLIAEA